MLCCRAAEDMQLYSPECIPLSVDTLERAVQWVWGLDRLAPVSSTDCAEAVLRAMLDPHVSPPAERQREREREKERERETETDRQTDIQREREWWAETEEDMER